MNKQVYAQLPVHPCQPRAHCNGEVNCVPREDTYTYIYIFIKQFYFLEQDFPVVGCDPREALTLAVIGS